MAIEHRMDGAFRRDGNPAESANEALADFAGAPAGVLALHVQDKVLHLKGKLVRVTIGASAPIGQPVNPALLVAIKDLVTGLARDPKLPAEICHRFAG